MIPICSCGDAGDTYVLQRTEETCRDTGNSEDASFSLIRGVKKTTCAGATYLKSNVLTYFYCSEV
jgi:hypothetical protein